jgi:hypothetical protein
MKKGRILKIRPFNMANFSAGSGYLPVMYFLDLIALIPYYRIMVNLTAKKNEDGLRPCERTELFKRLFKNILPFMFLSAVAWTAFMLIENMGYSGIKSCLPLYLLCGFMPFVVVFSSLFLAIATNNRNMSWGYLLTAGILFVIIGAALSYPLSKWFISIAELYKPT